MTNSGEANGGAIARVGKLLWKPSGDRRTRLHGRNEDWGKTLRRHGERWKLRRPGWTFLLGTIAAASLVGMTPRPGFSAEEIILTYGFFERTIQVEDLAAFARGEHPSRQLAAYIRLFNLSERQLEEIRRILNLSLSNTLSQSLTLNNDSQSVNEAVLISQFLYTRQGQALLEIVGNVMQTPPRQSGFYAVRAALILAAADQPEGLTILNFLEKFPAPAIRVDAIRGLAIADQVGRTLSDAAQSVALVHGQAAIIASEEPEAMVREARQLVGASPPYEALRSELRVPNRRFQANLYLPSPSNARIVLPTQVPVIVISHGLGDSRFSYDYLATYLARRGFVVVVPDHPGSNSQQIENLLEGLSQNVVSDEEFVARPQDVSALLDTLEIHLAGNSIWRDRINWQNVGIIGQSFGGYTALALAGAPVQTGSQPEICGSQLIPVNPSLLLQCQAESLSTLPPLQDDRVRAVLLVNPVGSALFGPTGYGTVQVPTLILAGVADTVAPALPEQIRPFTWLQTPDRYLVLVGSLTHFSVIPEVPRRGASLSVPLALIGPNPNLARSYLEVLSLGFFQTHLVGDTRYASILTARYLQEAMAGELLTPVSLIRDLPPAVLQQAISP
ncbi:alpha/beta hydrolase [Leptolyngbya sp. PCC 6406]|uniref:alpha/beta hydrolase n=1 Tax=Leptolyngbya sp. PCC 6406 TaxID=1173264 RepID=UPI00138AE646|nr:alpha/beta hydrolase [Leptolyngbya sp. PCC 6406]